jgi:hypothetical protein
MIAHSIKNTDNLCQTINSLLTDDIRYLKERSKFVWGDFFNLSDKIRQYEELPTLPLFNQLLSNKLTIDAAMLYSIKPNFLKIFFNRSAKTNNLNTTNIIIPLCNLGSSNWLSLKEERLKNYTTISDMEKVITILKNERVNLVDSYQPVNQCTPILLHDANLWTGLSNFKNTNYLNLLHISLIEDVSFEDLLLIFNQ